MPGLTDARAEPTGENSSDHKRVQIDGQPVFEPVAHIRRGYPFSRIVASGGIAGGMGIESSQKVMPGEWQARSHKLGRETKPEFQVLGRLEAKFGTIQKRLRIDTPWPQERI